MVGCSKGINNRIDINEEKQRQHMSMHACIRPDINAQLHTILDALNKWQ